MKASTIMKTSQGVLIALAVGLASTLTGVPCRGAPNAENGALLSELSGILHKDDKTIMPYLVLDGSEQHFYVRGSALATHSSGTRIHVKGVLRSELFDATGTDWAKPGAPAPPPFRKGWVVCMAVQEAKVATEPFAHSAEVRSPQPKDAALQTTYPLHCDVLSDGIPNPLTLRITNPRDTEVRFSTFMSTHTTMWPMPNVRLAITDTATHQTQHYTPVVLTEPRGSYAIAPGDSRDFPIAHRGLKLAPGIHELTVALFDNADTQQKTPVAVSSPQLVRVRKTPRTDAAREP
jgi:hypothetical protein